MLKNLIKLSYCTPWTNRHEDKIEVRPTKAKPLRTDEARLVLGLRKEAGDFSNKVKRSRREADDSDDDVDCSSEFNYEDSDKTDEPNSEDGTSDMPPLEKQFQDTRSNCYIPSDNDDEELSDRGKSPLRSKRSSSARCEEPLKKKKKKCVESDDDDAGFLPAASPKSKLPSLSDLQKLSNKDLRSAIEEAPATFENSASFWNMQLHIDVYVQGVVSSRRVGDEDLENFLRSSLAKFGDMPKVAALRLQPVIDSLESAKKALNDWHKTVESWQFPCDFEQERTQLFQHVAVWRKNATEAERHVAALQGLLQEHKAQTSRNADAWRKGRDRIRKWLEEDGVLPCIARVAGDLLQSKYKDPASVGVTLHYQPLPEIQEFGKDTFTKPLLLVEPAEVNDTNQWFSNLVQQVKAFFGANKTTAVSKMAESVKVMYRDRRNSAIATMDNAQKLDFKEPGTDEDVFDHPTLRTIVFSSFDLICDVTLSANPFRGVPLFLTQYVGSSLLILLPDEVVSKNLNLHDYLAALDPAGLNKLIALVLEEGQTIWVPLGWYAVTLSLKPGIDWKAKDVKLPPRKSKAGAVQRHNCAVGFYCIYDKALVGMASMEARLTLVTNSTQGMVSLPKSFRDDAGVKSFLEELKKEKDPVEIS